MKKIAIVAALLAVSSAAFAQSARQDRIDMRDLSGDPNAFKQIYPAPDTMSTMPTAPVGETKAAPVMATQPPGLPAVDAAISARIKLDGGPAHLTTHSTQ